LLVAGEAERLNICRPVWPKRWAGNDVIFGQGDVRLGSATARTGSVILLFDRFPRLWRDGSRRLQWDAESCHKPLAQIARDLGIADSRQYEVLPLADFGTVKFTDATATANGHIGSISDSNGTAEAVQLSSIADASRPAFVSEQSSTGAEPSSLSSDGSSFSVT
jgi:hypothetical protein